MKILIDVNLTSRWCEVLSQHGFEAKHWTQIGPADAPDDEILNWAHQNGYVVLTHDLDFSALLAASQADGPSVIQVRIPHPRPEGMQSILLSALRRYERELCVGTLVVIEPARSRVRRLPLRGKDTA